MQVDIIWSYGNSLLLYLNDEHEFAHKTEELTAHLSDHFDHKY